jgi:hypothetical protein
MPHPRRTLTGWAVAVLLLAGAVASADPPSTNPLVFPKDRFYLNRVRDFTELAIGGSSEGQREQEAFDSLVLHAHDFSTDELDAAARRDVPLGALLDRDDKARDALRYELVRFEGRLKRVVKLSGVTEGVQAGGVNTLYEAWVIPYGGAKTPVCFHVSELPSGVVPATDITPGVPVSGCGYFMKIVEYPSYEPDPDHPGKTLRRRAPLLIGRAVRTTNAPVSFSNSLDGMLTVSLLGGGSLIVALFLFAVWMRRSDHGTRRASALRKKNPYHDGPRPPVWEQPPPTPEPEPPAPTGSPNQS